MKRILSIDYGQKRTGLAQTDPMQIIASGIGWVPTAELMGWITKYVKEEKPVKVIIGFPTKVSGEDTDATPMVRSFEKVFKKKFPELPLERVDERFTSKRAIVSMVQAGVPKMKRRDKGLKDQVSATIILQDYLERK